MPNPMSMENPWDQMPANKKETPVLNFVESHRKEWGEILKRAIDILDKESEESLAEFHENQSPSERDSYPQEIIFVHDTSMQMHYLQKTFSREFNIVTQPWAERINKEGSLDRCARELASFLKEHLSLTHENPYKEAA